MGISNQGVLRLQLMKLQQSLLFLFGILLMSQDLSVLVTLLLAPCGLGLADSDLLRVGGIFAFKPLTILSVDIVSVRLPHLLSLGSDWPHTKLGLQIARILHSLWLLDSP